MKDTLPQRTIWTIGHSTHPLEDFVAMLRYFRIHAVADIRSYPGSRRYPHFNKEALELSLRENGIAYVHIPELGGRRKVRPDSDNTAWTHPAFRGYADHMDTPEFRQGAGSLIRIASQTRTAFMCSEAVWWQCHRSMVSDYLKSTGWTVMHITGVGKETEHRYTRAANLSGGALSYKGLL